MYNTWADLWNNLNHYSPKEFRKGDFEYLKSLVLLGLQQKHGEVKPKFSFGYITERGIYTDVEQNLPRLTVCYIRPQDPSPFAGRTVIGIAYCSALDNPNKAFGKALALKRAVSVLVERSCSSENFINEYTDLAGLLRQLHIPSIVKSFSVDDPNFVLNLRNE